MSTEPTKNNDIAPMLATATRHHQAGRLDEAEAMYQEILQKYPDQPDALQYMGLIAHHKNNSQSAIDLLRKAISINPFSADYYVNLGAIFKHNGRLRDALECYQTAIQLQPESAEAYNNLSHVGRRPDPVDPGRRRRRRLAQPVPAARRRVHPCEVVAGARHGKTGSAGCQGGGAAGERRAGVRGPLISMVLIEHQFFQRSPR